MLFGLLALAACGVKNAPQPLHPDSFPHQYPAPESAPAGEPAPTSIPGPPAPDTDTSTQPLYQ